MIPIIIVICSILLDGILTNFLPYSPSTLSLFTPLLTVVSFILIYPFYRKKVKKYYIISITIGLIYDLLYTNLLFINAILFLIIAYITKIIYKNIEVNYLNIILFVIVIISLYEALNGLIIVVFNLVPITIESLIYKITHSLLLNILTTEIIYIIIKYLPKKYKKININ